MNKGLTKAELWSNVLCTLEELEIDLGDLNESDDISVGERKAVAAMKRKLSTFRDYGINARQAFWNWGKAASKVADDSKEGGAK